MVICRFIARRDAPWSSRAKGHRRHLPEPAPRRDELRAGPAFTALLALSKRPFFEQFLLPLNQPKILSSKIGGRLNSVDNFPTARNITEV